MKEALKKAQEYALKQGYPSEVTYLKMWRLSHVFRIKQPADEDFGEPLVIVVESNGGCQIRPLSDVL